VLNGSRRIVIPTRVGERAVGVAVLVEAPRVKLQQLSEDSYV
jgi:hypothetical protein